MEERNSHFRKEFQLVAVTMWGFYEEDTEGYSNRLLF